MLVRYTLPVVAVALVVAIPIEAAHCTTYSTSNPELDLTALGLPYYVDNDFCQPDCIFSVWPYCESNGLEGLQRGDEVVDDTCHGMIEADYCAGL